MGFVLANHGLYTLLTSAISGGTDLRCLVCSPAGSPTDAQLEDLNFVSDIAPLGLVEVTNVNYARQDLGGVAVVEDDTNNRVAFTANAPTILNVATGDVWKRIVYYIEAASDATRPVIGVDTPATPLTPNGLDVIMPAFVLYLTDIST